MSEMSPIPEDRAMRRIYLPSWYMRQEHRSSTVQSLLREDRAYSEPGRDRFGRGLWGVRG